MSRTLTSVRTGGRAFFVAPELVIADVLRPTESSDIYSLAITIYVLAIATSNCLVNEETETLNGIREVQIATTSGQVPPCPDSLGGLDKTRTDSLYKLLNLMWSGNAQTRVDACVAKAHLMDIADYLDADFKQFGPAPYANLLPESDFLQLSQQLISGYRWNDVRAGSWMITSFHPRQGAALAAGLIYLILSPHMEREAQILHLNHMKEIILMIHKYVTPRPYFFYNALATALQTTSTTINWEHIAVLLIVIGVSRPRVVEICGIKGNRVWALLEHWDTMRRNGRSTSVPNFVVSLFCAVASVLPPYSTTVLFLYSGSNER